MNSCHARILVRKIGTMRSSSPPANVASVETISTTIIAKSSSSPALCRRRATHSQELSPSSISARVTRKPRPCGSIFAGGTRPFMNPTSSASSLPGKYLPARSRHGPPKATGIVRQPSRASVPPKARQAARSSSLSVCGTILLLPENIVHLVFDFDT